MFSDVVLPEGFWFFIAIAIALLVWRFWGAAFFERINQRRRDAELQAFYDQMNPHAHFRQTIDAINEETPPVQAGNGRATWGNEIYSTREDADAARWRHVLMRARDFYKDIDRMYGRSVRGRRGDTIGSGDEEAKRE